MRRLHARGRDFVLTEGFEVITRDGFVYCFDLPMNWDGLTALYDLVERRIDASGWPTRGEDVWDDC